LQTAQTTFAGKYVVKVGSLAFTDQTQLGALPASTQADYFTLDGGGLLNDSGAATTIDPKRGITLGANGGSLYFSGAGLTYNGLISGTQGGGILVAPDDGLGSNMTGTVTLNSANTYNGRTWIATGATLSVGLLGNGGVNSAIGSSTAAATNLVLDGGTLLYRGDAVSTNRNFTLTNAGGNIDASGANNAPLVFTSTAPIGLSGTGSRILVLRGTSTGDNTMSLAITDQGANPTTLNKIDAGTWVLTNTANSYTGNTIISAGGRLKLGASGVIPDASLVQMFSASYFDLNGYNETVKSISGTSGTIVLGSKTLTLNSPNGDTYSGAITGNGGRILVNGGGRLTLQSTATYDGGVTSNGGQLGIGTDATLGSGYFGVNNAVLLGSVVTTPLTLKNSVVLNGNITFDDYTFISNPGSIIWDPNGANHWTLYGGDRMIAVSSIPGTYGITINQPISEDGTSRGLVKGGNGKLTLNAPNSYTGNTTIQDGILSLSQPSLADASAVIMAGGATLNLTFGSNTADTVGAFYIDGVLQASGTWGGIGSVAQHQTALITGTGFLYVGPPPVSNQPLAGDFNSDGKVDNGDYLTWRKAYGSDSALANDNGLGTPIGDAHLVLWRQRFGNTSGSGPTGGLASGTIPEPATRLLLISGMAAFSMLKLHRARPC
jgi:fibronectin-binding autotransporter adhesin